VACEDQEYILHLEFQLEHEVGFPRRMGLYHNLLAEQFNLPVLSVALYLKPRKTPIPNEYVVRLYAQTINRFTYPVLRLWDYVDDIRGGKFRELAPFLVMLVDKADAAVLHTERELILAEADPKKRAELLSLAVPIAARYFDKNFLWRFFREELEMLKGTSFIDDWIQEGVEKGLQQGLQQGQQQGRLEEARASVLKIIRERFELTLEQAESLATQVDQIEHLPTLKGLFSHALHDPTLDRFLARLK
jgi:predicted transposase YdaD